MRSMIRVRRAACLWGVPWVLSLLAACGGGGGDGVPAQPQAGSPPPGGSAVTFSGKASFDYVPNVGGALRYDAVEERPIAGATLEVVDATTQEVLASTQTLADGAWSATVPTGHPVRVRVKAQMRQPGRWQVEVRDNTQGDGLYAIETEPLDGRRTSVHVHAGSGWTGASYGSPRAAGPFAMLAAVRASQDKVLSADAHAVFPPLALYWSPNNLPAAGDRALGEIGVTHFRRDATPMAIYVLGRADVDTDEHDESVVAHEWGHYYQAVFSRNDSLDGPHDGLSPLEMTVAFSEGWGDAWQSIALGRADYADSSGPRQAEPMMAYDVLAGPDAGRKGWFSERSVAQVLAAHAREVGFGPVHRAMQALRQTPAYTSIHSLAATVRRQDPAAADKLDILLQGQRIVASLGSDEFGAGETNDGGLLALDIDQPQHYFRPPYLPLTDAPNGTVMVCSTSLHGRTNRHGVYRALRFDVAVPGRYWLEVATADSSYPYIAYLYGGRRLQGRGNASYAFLSLDLSVGPFVFSVADGRIRDTGEPADYDCPMVRISRQAS